MFENLINFFKLNTKKVKDFFLGKPKTYLLGNGQELDLGGEINQRPLYSFFANLGDKLVKYTEKAKQKAHLSKINNQPLEYSTALTEVKKSKTVENTGLLNQDPQRLNAPQSIIPEPVLEQASSIPAPALNVDLIKNTPKTVFRYTSTSKIPMYRTDEEINLNKRKSSISSLITRHHRRSLAVITAYTGYIAPKSTIDKTISNIPDIKNDRENL